MKKIYLIIFLILIFAGVFAWYMFEQGQKSFMLRDVKLEIIAPEHVASGQEITYLVKYINNTKATLEQAELSLDNNHQEALGDLAPGQQGEIELKKSLFGQQGEIKIIKAKLKYLPSNFRSFFETETQIEISVKSSSIIASLGGPEQASNGQLVEYTLNYANKSDSTFENLEIKFIYPDGFESDQDTWQINKLEPDEIGQLKIQGILSGEHGQEKEIIAQISKITQVSAKTKIIGSPLSLEQIKTDNGYIIKYENKSQLSLEQVEITMQFKSQALDFDTVEVENGSFDKFAKKITWNSGGVPGLALLEPNTQGQINFIIRLKDPLPEQNNFALKTIAQIKSGEIKNSQELEIKLDSQFILQTRAYYASGQLPPKVNQNTYYNIHWQLLNGANNLEETVITASLPLGLDWQGQVNKDYGRLYYDQETNEVVWDLGQVPAWVGRSQAVYEAVFQIALRPVPSQANKIISVLNETILITKDSFTEKTLTARNAYITSDLPDDANISYSQGIIQP